MEWTTLRGMKVRFKVRLVWAVFLLVGLFCALGAQEMGSAGSGQKPLPLQPVNGGIHRLILKDGSYQPCRSYEVVGDRVRYTSTERGGETEELPAELVDWDATHKWEREHASAAETESPGMREAASLDREEAASRAAAMARRPEIVPGLGLPDEDGVFALDNYQGQPQLVEVPAHEADVNVKEHKGIEVINPLAGASAHIELDGTHAKVHLHVNDPVFYLSLDSRDDAENVISHALVVKTGSAGESPGRKHGARSLESGFYVVRVDERKTVRIVAALHQGLNGKMSENADTIELKAEVLAGKLWLKLTPKEKLMSGEYALVEMLPDGAGMSATVWDFAVDPRSAENPGAYGPVEREKR